jgi:hypothetical protein
LLAISNEASGLEGFDKGTTVKDPMQEYISLKNGSVDWGWRSDTSNKMI